VTFPPGLLRLATRPNLTGSPPVLKTIGIVAVAALAATADYEVGGVPLPDLSRCSNLSKLRGRDASYLAPPAQIRTCGFPAYGSHLGSNRQSNCRMRSGACATRAWR
jgi:hypothetical protein